MEKDYYKILEVDREASEEIIEKAYRTLAKKYHPDLQNSTNQKVGEEKLKEINEAYEVLSNEYKKSVYDSELNNTTFSQEEIQKLINENRMLKERLQQIEQIEQMEQIERIQRSQQVYNNNYNENVEYTSDGINFKNKIKYYLKFAIIILIIMLVFLLIYQIPSVKNLCYKIYTENIFIKVLVDTFTKTFQTGF